jgi:hypothetical protein
MTGCYEIVSELLLIEGSLGIVSMGQREYSVSQGRGSNSHYFAVLLATVVRLSPASHVNSDDCLVLETVKLR